MSYYLYGVEADRDFECNISGMSDIRDGLERFGMLAHHKHRPFPEVRPFWPDPNDSSGFDGALDMYADQEFSPERPGDVAETDWKAALAFQAVVEAVLVEEPAPVEGIPAYKTGSNDRWLVTPGEISAALEAFDRNRPADYMADPDDPWSDESFFLGFVDFLRACRDGGFRVS